LSQRVIQVAVACEAGDLVRATFPRTALTVVGFKGAVNPVTETDVAAENLIIARLRAAFPDHRFYVEESGGDDWRTPGPPIWLVDPLGGTINSAHGFPTLASRLRYW
jgi:myo-inositol-1(or 4)-monophosphatase